MRLWEVDTTLFSRRGLKDSKDYHKDYQEHPKDYPKYLDHYDSEELKKKIDCGADTILSFPICNSYSFSQIEARIDIFLNFAKSDYLRQSERIARPLTEDVVSQKIANNEEVKVFDKEVKSVLERQLELTLDDIIQQIAVVLERLWGNLAYQKANEFMDNIHHCSTTKELLHQFGEWLKKSLECDVFTPYRVMELEDNTYLVPPEDSSLGRIAQNRDDDICSRVWKYQDFGFQRPEGSVSEFAFPLYDQAKHWSDLAVPNVTHVIQCRFNTNKPQRLLTASDENIIRELLHDFLPVFSNCLATEKRAATLGIIVHETRYSLINLHGALCRIDRELKNRSIPLTNNYYETNRPEKTAQGG